jgi:Trk-type K+ transport system membrane component
MKNTTATVAKKECILIIAQIATGRLELMTSTVSARRLKAWKRKPKSGDDASAVLRRNA